MSHSVLRRGLMNHNNRKSHSNKDKTSHHSDFARRTRNNSQTFFILYSFVIWIKRKTHLKIHPSIHPSIFSPSIPRRLVFRHFLHKVLSDETIIHIYGWIPKRDQLKLCILSNTFVLDQPRSLLLVGEASRIYLFDAEILNTYLLYQIREPSMPRSNDIA